MTNASQIARAFALRVNAPAPSSFLLMLLAAALLSGCRTTSRPASARRAAFTGITDFSRFTRTPGPAPREIVLTSPELNPPIRWNELVVSWNTAPGAHLKVEARGIYPDHATAFYILGWWSDSPDHPRTSVNGQNDADGAVKTDTLELFRPGARVQLRLTLGAPEPPATGLLKFIGLSFCDTRAPAVPAAPNRAAWGRSLPVPELRQGDFAGGGAWCSPVSLSMVMGYWSATLHRPELARPVPEVAAAVYDPAYAGAGNWPFNTAYAGQFPGLRAYTARLNDLSEVETWVAAGVPVILSVSSYLTNNRHSGPDNGHLIVVTGFTAQGDVIANNPGVSVKRGQRARCIYPRDKVIAAWKKSHFAVYLIYPEKAPI